MNIEPQKAIELIQRMKEQIQAVKYDRKYELNGLIKRVIIILEKAFGVDNKYLDQIKGVDFSNSFPIAGQLFNELSWEGARGNLVAILTNAQEDLEIAMFATSLVGERSIETKRNMNGDIFIVHGHNEEIKLAVARTLEKLRLTPIILHEQASKGRTLIEKFADHANVLFAIVILSADDIGYSRQDESSKKKYRARQNVILELGFFLGKLGRQNVFVLYEGSELFEFPSDYSGVVYASYDKSGKWKYDLVKELRVCGFDVDANNII